MNEGSALRRARALLTRPGAWIDQSLDDLYPIRLSPDRRGRVLMRLDEAGLTALIAEPGLRPRPGGGWIVRTEVDAAPDQAARPGVIAGERDLPQPDGRMARHRANLGESPLAWLARRRDASGSPLIDAVELAAGDRLRRDAERSAAGPSLTMRWDALPRSRAGSATSMERGDAALAAARRVRLALSILPPLERAMVDAVCVWGSSLQLAETGLGLRRRGGRLALRRGLAALAAHYGSTAEGTSAHRPPGDR